ncbi:hypothetical protein RCC89_08920 [Cytophagaceae bacterium ABcell3]|nr:hypothetical protein RCC89_08920 [Cytophagaceae bacterium ABcell3]
MLQNTCDLDHELRGIEVPSEDFCIVGGAALSMLGIREHNDIDIVLNRSKYRDSPSDITSQLPENVDVKVGWGMPFVKDDKLIHSDKYYLRVNGYKIARPEVILGRLIRKHKKEQLKDIKLLEEYATSSEHWDWNLVKEFAFSKKQVKKNKPKLLKRLSGVWDGGINKFRGFLYRSRNDSAFVFRFLLAKVNQKLSGISPNLQAQMMQKVPVGAILGRQFIGNEFARYDVLLRYLTARSIDLGDHRLKPVYKQMQKARVNRDTYMNMVILVKSVKRAGFNASFPLPLTQEGRVIDGAHRLATALYFKIAELPVDVKPVRQVVDYRRSVLSGYGIEEPILQALDKVRDELFEREGVWFPLIVWPPAQEFLADIVSYVKKRYRVPKVVEIDLSNRLEDFVRKVNVLDNTELWKVELGINDMLKFLPKVSILAVEIPEPTFSLKNVCLESEKLKSDIHNNFKCKMDNYFDFIFSMGKNHEQNKRLLELVRVYEAEYNI